MKLREENLRLNIIINGDAGRKEVLRLEESMDNATVAIKALRDEKKALVAQGKENTDEYAKLTKEIDKQDAALKAQKTEYNNFLRMQQLEKLSLHELTSLRKAAQVAFKNAIPGTYQYKKAQQELQAVTMQMKRLKTTAKETGSVLKRSFNFINSKIGGLMAAVASLFVVTSALERANEQFRELDEAQVDAQKTTGLTATGVDELSASLAKIDTRTTQNELLAISRIAGKLGIQGKNDIEEFTDSADKITVALKEDLGGNVEEVITQVGKLNDIFGLNAEYGYGQSMLKTASALNELGMASTASEGYLVDFAGRVAGTAPNVEISIQSILGLGATLDKFKQTSEVAGTTYGQVISAMFKRTETFAKIAKMEISEFSKLMNEDMNEAFIRVLEGMNGNDMASVVESLGGMKLEGQRAQQVLGVLAKNTGELRRQQGIANKAFAEGTSILNEFNIKNDSATARYEKHKKAMTEQAIVLGEMLNPLMENSRSIMVGSLKVLITLIQWIYKARGVLIPLVATYVTYKGILLSVAAVSKSYAVVVGVLRSIKLSYLLAVRAVTMATAVQTATTKKATIATRLLTLAFKASPWGWLAVVIGAVVGVLSIFYVNVTKATTAQKVFNDVNKRASQLEDEHGESIVGKAEKMRQLMRIIEDTTTAENHRNAAIIELQRLIPNGINLINAETIANGKAAEAVAEYTDQLVLQARLKAAIEERKAKIDEYAKGTLPGEDNHGEQHWSFAITGRIAAFSTPGLTYKDLLATTAEQDQEKAKTKLDEEVAVLDKLITDIQTEFKDKKNVISTGEWTLDSDEIYLKQRQELKKKYLSDEIKDEDKFNKELLNLEIKTIEARLKTTAKGSDEQIKLQNELTDKLMEQKRQNTNTGGGDVGEWSLSSDDAYLQKRQDLKQQYLKGEIKTEQEYNDQLLALEIQVLKARLTITDKDSKDQLRLQGELTDKLIEQKKRDAKRKEQADVKERKDNSAKLDDAEATIKAQQQLFEAEKEAKTKQHKQDILFFEGTARERREKRKQQMQEQKDLEAKHLKNLASQLEEIINNGTFDDIKIDTELLSEEEIAELEQKLERVRTLLGAAAAPPEVEEEPKFSFEGKNTDILGLSQDDWTLFMENLKNGEIGFEEMCFAAQAMVEAYAMYDQFATNAENRQLDKFKKSNDQKKKSLDSRLDAGLISQDAYNAQTAQMDAEYDAMADEMRIKQAKRDKAISISSAIINTAIGVTAALGVPIVGIALAALIGAMGAAQVALIASTPIETSGAEEGGLVAERMQDGKRFNAKYDPNRRGRIDKPTVLVSENGAEYVIPADGVNNPTLSPFIGAIERARKSGSLGTFNFDAVHRQPTVVPGYSKGGAIAPNRSSTPIINTQTVDNDTFELLTTISKQLEDLNKKADNPIPAITTVTGSHGIKQALDSYYKSKNKGKLGGV